MTKSEFITLHIDAILALTTADAKKKELTVLLFQYLLSFKKREVEFHIDHFAKYSGLAASFLNQPYDTYKQPDFAAPVMDVFGLRHLLIDENKYQSLLESALILLMMSNIDIVPERYFHYTVISSIIKSDKKDEFFASEFQARFSEDFWHQLKTLK